MTQKTINLGTADQGNGDPLRVAFSKVNDNFTELYTALGLDGGGLNLGAFEFTGSTLTTTDSSAVTIDQQVNITSDLVMSGDIVPAANGTYSLGTLERQWKSIHVQGSTIYFNGVPLSITDDGTLYVNNQVAATPGGALTWDSITGKPSIPADVSDLTDTQGLLDTNTGNIAFDTGGTAAGIYNSQGGGIFISNFSYITAEAETAWIEIPEGNSSNPLRIVQEQGNVGIVASNQAWTFETNGKLTVPTVGGEGLFIQGAEIGSTNSGIGITATNSIVLTTDALGVAKFWTLGVDGNLTFPGNIIPATDNLQDIGSPTARVRHVYVGPGSVYIGNNVITESATGGLVLPGVTRATGYYAEEVDNEDDWGSNPTITGAVTVIDATRYEILAGQTPSANYSPATYTAQKEGNKVDEITVSNGGGGWTKAEADYARDNNMYATNVVGAINNFNAGDWQEIPFRVEIKAEDTEYEDIFGGGADLGSFTIDSNVLSVNSGTDIYIETYETGGDGESRLVLKPQDNGSNNPTRLEGSYGVGIWSNITDSEDTHKWLFGTDGDLQLPGGATLSSDTVNGFTISQLAIDEETTLSVNFRRSGEIIVPLSIQFNLLDTPTGFVGAQLDSLIIAGNPGKAIDIAPNDGANGTWSFGTDGNLQLPAGGDILNSEGNSVLGGGAGLTIITPEEYEVSGVTTLAFTGAGVSVDRIDDITTVTITGGGGDNSYTPEDPDHWNEPTVNTVAAALDELAARLTALQNYEIDGGNANTPAEAELLIDGNGA